MKKSNANGFGAIEALIVLVVVVVIGVAGYMFYQNGQKATEDDTSSAANSSTTTTQPTETQKVADPYAGWTTLALKYEKLNLKYPNDWTAKDNSKALREDGVIVSPGTDRLVLTSPSGLQVTVDAGVTGIGGGPYQERIVSIGPIATMGGNYFLGFGAEADDSDTTNTTNGGCVGTTDNLQAGFLISKHISVPGGDSEVYNIVCIGYPYKANGDITLKTMAEFQGDPSFNDAKLIVESLAY